MYDILQLNDMLLPELLSIAEQLKIKDAKSADKQALIYKILDTQAVKGADAADATKKKRTRKPTTVRTTTSMGVEEAEVVNAPEPEPVVEPIKQEEPAAVTKRPRKIIKPIKVEPIAEAEVQNFNKNTAPVPRFTKKLDDKQPVDDGNEELDLEHLELINSTGLDADCAKDQRMR